MYVVAHKSGCTLPFLFGWFGESSVYYASNTVQEESKQTNHATILDSLLITTGGEPWEMGPPIWCPIYHTKYVWYTIT